MLTGVALVSCYNFPVSPLPVSGNFRLKSGKSFQEDRIDKRFIRMNERIRAREIRVIGADGEQLGIMAPMDATRKAREQNLDLVEISPTANPPVCRIMDYGKFLYGQEFPVVHDAADRGIGGGRDLYQVKILFAGLSRKSQ